MKTLLLGLCLLVLAPLAQAKSALNCSALRIIGTSAMELRQQGYSQPGVRAFVIDEMDKNPKLSGYQRQVTLRIVATAYYLELSPQRYGDFVFDQCLKQTHSPL